jgi:sulfonate transport system permease protein
VTVLDLRGAAAAAPRTFSWHIPRSVARLSGVVLALALWELVTATGWVAPDQLAGPLDVVRTGWHLLVDDTLLPALWVSLQRVLWGLAIGVPIGVVLAAVAGLSRIGENLVDSPVQMLRFLPVLALIPLDVLWFGIGNVAKISLIVLGVTIPVYINTYAAIGGIDPRYHELARSLGLSRRETLRRVVLPGALPGFLVGFRLSVSVAWLILVVSEQINATNGIGYLMVKAQEFFESDVIVVALAVYALLGLTSDIVLRAVERRALAWRPSLQLS